MFKKLDRGDRGRTEQTCIVPFCKGFVIQSKTKKVHFPLLLQKHRSKDVLFKRKKMVFRMPKRKKKGGTSLQLASPSRLASRSSRPSPSRSLLLKLVLLSLFPDLFGSTHLHLARSTRGFFVVFVLTRSDGLALSLKEKRRKTVRVRGK